MSVDRRCAGRRAGSALAVAALLAGGLTALPAVAAPLVAEPVYPSQEQVDGAKRAAADKATQIGAIESQLAAASANLESMQIAAQMAAEDYNEAVVELEQATAAAEAARATADRALLDVEAARTAIGRLAANTYRSGSGLAGIEVFLSADGPQDLLDKAATIDALADRRQHSYQRMEAAELVAQLLDEQAQEAQQAQEDAAAAAEEARAEAQRSAAAAAAEVDRVAATRTDLIAQLAVLRDTSVELEQERQEGLEAERRAREEAAARAAAERRERERAAAERAASDGAAAEAAERRAAERAAAEQADRDNGASAPAPSTPPPAPDPPSTPPGSSEGSSSAGRAAVAWARDQIGKPYQWGATGPGSFDCSGLTSQAWQNGGGVWITRTSRSQYRAVEKVSYSRLRVGDLIFYGNGNDSSSIHHVAVYSGGGRMVEAARAGTPVREVPMRMSGTMDFAGRP
ncbi:MAG TPA: C40 family peptidase [Actinomycetales bacterium]|nr:C40 family peptidase [Actinomycetales bacterium]